MPKTTNNVSTRRDLSNGVKITMKKIEIFENHFFLMQYKKI